MTTTITASDTITAFVPSSNPEVLIEPADVPVPEPRPDEALIAVDAYSINRGEVYLLERPRPAWRPGQDVAGRVVRAAVDGSGPAEGTRVVAHADSGGWAPLVAVAVDAVAALPEEVSTETAATLPLAGLTALRLLRAAGSVVGRRVLITGASGGVGHALTELAVGAGAEVVAIASTPARGERLGQLGAQAAPDVEATQGRFDVAFESVGGAVPQQVLSRLAPGGTLLWYGQTGRTPLTIDFFAALAAPGARIQVFSYWAGQPAVGGDLATLVRLVGQGRLHPEIGLRADWRETPAALVAVRDRQVRGNAVLTVSGAQPGGFTG